MASTLPGSADPATRDPSPSARRRRWPPTLAFALGAGFTVWAASIGLKAIADNSFMTHLATGRSIVAGGGIPRHDPY